MKQEAPELRLLRESLEGTLEPTLAQNVLFEAMERRGGHPPPDRASLESLAQNELAVVLTERVGARTAADILADIMLSLGRMPADPPRMRGRDDTASIPHESTPLGVLVSASGGVGARLHAAIGPDRMTLTSARNAVADAALLRATPAVVLIDGADFAAIEPSELAALLSRVPSTTARLLYGPDLPYGAAVLRAVAEIGESITTLDRREGLAPLLDVIRSRARP